MNFSIVKENILEKGKRILKVIEFGAKTAKVVSSFGDDSAPLKDMIAIYSKTSESGDAIIVGYINKDQISQPGEKRIFSLKPDGSLSTSIHLKGDETIEIGGSQFSSVRFEEMQIALTSQKNLINAELAKISLAINSLAPGSYTPSEISIEIDGAKNEKVKIG